MIPASASEGHIIILPPGYNSAGGYRSRPEEFCVEKVLELPGDPSCVFLYGVFTDDGPDAEHEHILVTSAFELEVLG